MDRVELSTEHLSEREQFAYWREECLQGIVGVTPERGEGASFSAKMEALIGGSALRMRIWADNLAVSRTSREIARVGWQDWVCVASQVGDGMFYEQPGRERQCLGPRDVLVFDPSLPLYSAGGAGLKEMWMLPRALLSPHLPAGGGPVWLRLSGGDGVNGLILAYLSALGEQMASLTNPQLDAVVDNLSRLIAIGCGAAAGEQREAVHAARLEQIKRYVNLHLAEPGLSPAGVAAAHKMSVRQLHRLFEPTGTSFAQFVVSRRLEECRATLLSPAGAGRAVGDIALGWGFNSLPAFYRSFSTRYGLSPRDLRASMRRER